MREPRTPYEGSTGPLANDLITAAWESNGFVIEIGIANGTGSTMMFQEALEEHPNPLHISVEGELEWLSRPDVVVPKSAYWRLVCGDSRDESTLLKVVQHADGRHPGVIFIDTDHNYDQMQAELRLWGKIADHQTTWLMHDTWMFGPEHVEMNRAIKEYAAEFGWVYDDLRTDSHGLGRLRHV